MTRIRSLLLAFLVAGTFGAACAPAQVTVSGPRLVWVSPGVWVVEAYPDAVYFADGFYWRTINGVWHRSPYYDSYFVRVDARVVPRHVVAGYNPRRHVNYRAPREAYVTPIDRRTQRPIIRDHRHR